MRSTALATSRASGMECVIGFSQYTALPESSASMVIFFVPMLGRCNGDVVQILDIQKSPIIG